MEFSNVVRTEICRVSILIDFKSFKEFLDGMRLFSTPSLTSSYTCMDTGTLVKNPCLKVAIVY